MSQVKRIDQEKVPNISQELQMLSSVRFTEKTLLSVRYTEKTLSAKLLHFSCSFLVGGCEREGAVSQEEQLWGGHQLLPPHHRPASCWKIARMLEEQLWGHPPPELWGHQLVSPIVSVAGLRDEIVKLLDCRIVDCGSWTANPRV